MAQKNDDGRKRTALHQGQWSQRNLADGLQDVIGGIGEDQYELEFGYRRDRRELIGGDGGKDFDTALGITDVKSSRDGREMLVVVHGHKTPWYVAAHVVLEPKSATLQGAMRLEDVMTYRQGYKRKDGPLDYIVPVRDLISMSEYRRMMTEAELKKNSAIVPHDHVCPQCRKFGTHNTPCDSPLFRVCPQCKPKLATTEDEIEAAFIKTLSAHDQHAIAVTKQDFPGWHVVYDAKYGYLWTH